MSRDRFEIPAVFADDVELDVAGAFVRLTLCEKIPGRRKQDGSPALDVRAAFILPTDVARALANVILQHVGGEQGRIVPASKIPEFRQ